jgi:ubiquinone/menaquinone biosynthesis C-methylase UbiE
MDNLQAYYAKRAAEYERIYAKPERQADLALLRSRVAALCAGRNVLEIACGTGYWTEVVAPNARSITAIDYAEETLAIARTKKYPANRVEFAQGDAYALPDFGRQHDALLAVFWWSHVPLARLDSFLGAVARAVAPGAIVAFLDNRYVEGSSTPVSRRDEQGNSYQTRRLADGSTHDVLKNFPTERELIERASMHGHDPRIEWLDYYWLLVYRTKRND